MNNSLRNQYEALLLTVQRHMSKSIMTNLSNVWEFNCLFMKIYQTNITT